MSREFNPTTRFSSRVGNYVRYRPGYPAEIIDLLRQECALKKDSPIADIGSGTGKLTELFLRNGNPVLGVEPNREMREAGERLLEQFPHFQSVDGTAEATTLPDRSVDFITIGQAFHWFDLEPCRVEFSRILKPGGRVVIIWNDRLVDTTSFLAAYEQLLREFSTDYERVNHRSFNDGEAVRDLLGGPARLKHFPSAQQFDFDGLKGRLLSSSYAPEAGQPKHNEMIDALKRVFETHQKNGRVVFEYETHVYYGQLN
jgi:SAM-dependent methyltransferase